MKKNLLFILTLVGASIVVSCDRAGQPGNPGSAGKTIVFYHSIGQEKMRNLQVIIEKFNADHASTDGYEVKAEHIAGDYDALHDAVKTRLNAGTTPSITMGYPDSFSEYMGSKGEQYSTILKLDDFISNDSNFNPSDMVDMYYQEGQHYQYSGTWSVPLYKSTEVLYYNIAAFQATQWYADNNGKTEIKKDLNNQDYEVRYGDPSTWDWETLVTAARAIQAEKGGTADFHALGYDSDANLFITQMAQRNIPYTSAQGSGAEHFKFYDATQEKPNDDLLALASEVYDLTSSGAMVTQGSYGNYASNLFLQQKVMFTIGSTGGSAYNDPKGAWEVGLAPVPTYRNNKKYIMQGPSLSFFNLDDPLIQQAAWDFYSQYLSDPTLNANLSLENSYDPVRKSSYESQSYAEWTALGFKDDGSENTKAELAYRIPSLTKTLTNNYMTSDVFIGSSSARVEMGNLIKYAQSESSSLSTQDKMKNALRRAFENSVNATLGTN